MMTAEKFYALAKLAGVGEGSCSHDACYYHFVRGNTIAESARLAGINRQTAANAKQKLVLKAAELPQLLATVRAAMGDET